MTTQQIIWAQINPSPGGGTSTATGTNADTTMVTNTIYLVDMSGWGTADRTYTCPASPTVGDVVGIDVRLGNVNFELIIKGGGSQHINNQPPGVEWSRLMITGECVLLRYVATDNWVVEIDRRIPIQVLAYTSGTQSMVNNTAFHPTWSNVLLDNSSAYESSGISCFRLRRAGQFMITTSLLSASWVLTGTDFVGIYTDIVTDPNGTIGYISSSYRTWIPPSTSGRLSSGRALVMNAAADVHITAEYLTNGPTGNILGADYHIVEVL